MSEKIYDNYDGMKIKIVFSNLGRRYKKIGDQLYLMLEKEKAKLEDSLTAMVRIAKENEEINKKRELEEMKLQTKIKIQKIEETKNDKIKELEEELQKLKILYEKQQKVKELTTEIEAFKEKIQPRKEKGIEITEERYIETIDANTELNIDEDQTSKISDTYTELINITLKNNEKTIENIELEVNYEKKDEK